jgi:hypothetical protein
MTNVLISIGISASSGGQIPMQGDCKPRALHRIWEKSLINRKATSAA